MLKILTIIGARPQIIKAAALSRAISNHFSESIKEVIVHTGQHYDENMSKVFFDELGIPQPDYNLGVGSGLHGKQTSEMIEGIEEILLKEQPVCIVLYGDTNSTLAGAVVASKLQVPIVHIEAGLRSFNKSMPEEVNRILCDHVSTLLFSPTETGVNNLVKEGFSNNNKAPYTSDNPKIYHCGDIMYDNSLYFSTLADSKDILGKHELKNNNFILATIHRNNNTDDATRLNAIFSVLNTIAEKDNIKIIIPLHPRTSKMLKQQLQPGLNKLLSQNANIVLIPPVSFLEMIALEKNSKLIITDSGGVQKEAYFFRKPCIVLRSETEWVELVKAGAALIADADEKKILDGYKHFITAKNIDFSPVYGNGRAAEFICGEILKTFQVKQ